MRYFTLGVVCCVSAEFVIVFGFAVHRHFHFMSVRQCRVHELDSGAIHVLANGCVSFRGQSGRRGVRPLPSGGTFAVMWDGLFVASVLEAALVQVPRSSTAAAAKEAKADRAASAGSPWQKGDVLGGLHWLCKSMQGCCVGKFVTFIAGLGMLLLVVACGAARFHLHSSRPRMSMGPDWPSNCPA